MDEIRVIEVKRGIFDDNNRDADLLRAELAEKGVFLLNLMSSPGSGKTSTLIKVINILKDELNIAVMEADIDSDVDAKKILSATGVQSVQLHTGGMCHLDAHMTRQGLGALDLARVDVAVLETWAIWFVPRNSIRERPKLYDTVRAGGRRQAVEISFDVLRLRFGDNKQNRRRAPFRFRRGKMQRAHTRAQPARGNHLRQRKDGGRNASVRRLAQTTSKSSKGR